MARPTPKSGMKVTFSVSISLEEAIALKALADKKETSPQEIVRDLISKATK